MASTTRDANYYETEITATFEGEPGAVVQVTSSPTDYGDQLVVETRTAAGEFLGVELTETETEELIATLQAALAYQRAHGNDA